MISALSHYRDGDRSDGRFEVHIPLATELGRRSYFVEAARQTGASTSNDYIDGAMHSFFRQRLFNLYATVPNAVAINELPDYVSEALIDQGQGIKDIVSGAVPPPYPGFLDSLRIGAPLAVQILSRPGFFPFNKFSSVPLGIAAARRAFSDAKDQTGNNDKRLMIVTGCHVKGLRTRTYTLATGASVQEVDGIAVAAKIPATTFSISAPLFKTTLNVGQQ